MDFARFCRLTLIAALLGSLSALYVGKRHVKAAQERVVEPYPWSSLPCLGHNGEWMALRSLAELKAVGPTFSTTPSGLAPRGLRASRATGVSLLSPLQPDLPGGPSLLGLDVAVKHPAVTLGSQPRRT